MVQQQLNHNLPEGGMWCGWCVGRSCWCCYWSISQKGKYNIICNIQTAETEC